VREGEAREDRRGRGGRVGTAGPEREWGRGRHDRNRRRSGRSRHGITGATRDEDALLKHVFLN
jgi:hypothetical protein